MLVEFTPPGHQRFVDLDVGPLGVVEDPLRPIAVELGVAQSGLGLFEGGPGSTPSTSADPPAGRTEPVADPGDDHRIRVRQSDVNHLVRLAIHQHGVAQQAVQQSIHTVPSGPHPGPDRFADPRSGPSGPAVVQGKHGSREVAAAQRLDSHPGPLGAVDHHRVERVAGRRLKCRLIAVVYLDQVEEGSQNPLNPRQMGCAGLGTGLVEGKREGLHQGPRATQVRLGRHDPLPSGVTNPTGLMRPGLQLGDPGGQCHLSLLSDQQLSSQSLGLRLQAGRGTVYRAEAVG